jgi:hypothetical protein
MRDELTRWVRPYDPGDVECAALADKPNEFLDTFSWAKARKNRWVAYFVPAVIRIFLVELDPQDRDVDQFIGVIVGDLPPAYLSPVYAKSPKDALDGYMGEMSAWADAVAKGESTADLIPVNGAPTMANVELLRRRIDFLGREIFPDLLEESTDPTLPLL